VGSGRSRSIRATRVTVRRDILDHLPLAVPSCLAGHVLDLRLAFAEGFLRDAPLAPIIRDAQAQELELFWSRYCAFRLVTASLSTEASGRCRFSQGTFAGDARQRPRRAESGHPHTHDRIGGAVAARCGAVSVARTQVYSRPLNSAKGLIKQRRYATSLAGKRKAKRAGAPE
jgi:hypothetical protein